MSIESVMPSNHLLDPKFFRWKIQALVLTTWVRCFTLWASVFSSVKWG